MVTESRPSPRRTPFPRGALGSGRPFGVDRGLSAMAEAFTAIRCRGRALPQVGRLPSTWPVSFTGFPISSSSGFSFNGSNVLFNLAGASALAGQQLILDVQTSSSAVPEPDSVILLGTGLLGGVAFLRRKFMLLF